MAGILNISQSQLVAARSNFAANYFDKNSNPNFAQDLIISWPQFISAVEVQGGISPTSRIVLKFIHMYDTAVNQWFLCMQVCHLAADNKTIDGYGNRFNLKTGQAPTPTPFAGNYDPNYFANITDPSGNLLNPTRYVNYVVYSWLCELKDMACENGIINTDNNAFIKFSCCSFDYAAVIPSQSLVQWPHVLGIFMNTTAHGDYLNNVPVVSPYLFVNKAANFSTVCPPCCGVYSWPATLPTTPECCS